MPTYAFKCRKCEKPFEKLADTHLHRHEPHAPETSAHQREAHQSGDQEIDIATTGSRLRHVFSGEQIASPRGPLEEIADPIPRQHALGSRGIKVVADRRHHGFVTVDNRFVSLDDQIACVERELAMRGRVYPRWVAQGKLTQSAADLEL